MARSKHPWRMLERNIEIYLKYEFAGLSENDLSAEYHVCPQRISQIVRNIYYREKHGDDEYIAEIDRQMLVLLSK